MIKKDTTIQRDGQTMVTLLVFVIIAISITSAAAIIIATNSLNAQRFADGNTALYIAEGGMENALLRLLRDPNYAGETLEIGQGTATITVTGTDTKTIVSEAQSGNFIRKIEVIADYSSNLTVTSWKETD